MKHNLLLLFLLTNSTILYSQVNSVLPINSAQISFGRSTHGTGDLKGISLNLEYCHMLKRNIFISNGLSGTIHNGQYPLFYTDRAGNTIDASYRHVTAGLQLDFKLGLMIVSGKKNKLSTSLGPLFRYQSSSYYDQINVLYPAVTGLPVPVMAIVNNSPLNTVSIGGRVALSYNYNINDKNVIGLNSSLQIDSRNDAIPMIMIAFGWSL